MSKKMKKSVLMLFVMVMVLMLPVTVKAAPSKSAVKKLYNSFLSSNTKYDWFRTLDINRDGVNELIVSQTKTATYEYDYYYIYTVKNNKVYNVGKIGESPSYNGNGKMKPKAVYYNKKLKGIRDIVTGPYSVGATLYKMYKYKLQNRLSMNAIYNRYRIFCRSVYGGPEAYYKTEAGYNKHFNAYFKKGCTRYPLYRNTAANRAGRL